MNLLLTGVRVLDLTRMLAGPYATLLLSDLGAEVIKIEEPGRGDEIRLMGPPFLNGQSPYFISVNRGKKSLALNLKSEEGLKIFYGLVGASDVVIDNFRPGVLERLKCEHLSLSKINPRIISCSITSFGNEGPLSQLPAFDLVIQAYSGAMSITGEPGGPPVRMGLPMGDLAGGMFAALAISAALNRRNSTGRGECISISLFEALSSMLTYVAQYYLADGKVPERQGSGHMSVVPYGAFATQDIYIVVAVFTEKFWAGFCEALAHPELVMDPRFSSNALRVQNRTSLEPILQEIFLQRKGDAWLQRLQEHGVPCAPVNTVERTLSSNVLTSIDQPGIGRIPVLASPIKVHDPGEVVNPEHAPLLGEHTRQILRDLLKISEEELATLQSRGIVGGEKET